MSVRIGSVRPFDPIVLGLGLLLALLPATFDVATANAAAPVVTATQSPMDVAASTAPAPPDSSTTPSAPIYRKKGVLIGAAVALVGVLTLVLGGGGSNGGDSPPGDTGLPGFPPPPSSHR